MTARLYLAPDSYGDPTIWRDTGHDRDEAVLTRHGGNWEGFDALAGAITAAERHFEARNMLGQKTDRLEAQLAEVRHTSRVLPCDGLCGEYPEEDCSLHGREPAELWTALGEVQERSQRFEAKVRAVEALIDRADRRVDIAHRLVTTTALRAALTDGATR